MKSVLDKEKPRQLRKSETSLPRRVEQTFPNNPFLKFTYTSNEMPIADDLTQIKSKKVQFADGKVKSEEFEGQLPVNVYEQIIRDSQRFFADQTMYFLKQFLAFLPISLKPPAEKD